VKARAAVVAEGPVRVRMLESVQLNTLGLTATKGSEVEADRERAAQWFLVAWCVPLDVDVFTREELQAAAPAALRQLRDEGLARGFSEERWMKVPNTERRYRRLFALVDGAAPGGGEAA
jgi:hypothetical protein